MIKLAGIARGLNEEPVNGTAPFSAAEYEDLMDALVGDMEELQMMIIKSLESAAEATGDTTYEQSKNQAARYLDTAQKNIEFLKKMLKRKY